MAQLVKKNGGAYQEVKLETNGAYGPHHVFKSVPFRDVVKVREPLVDM